MKREAYLQQIELNALREKLKLIKDRLDVLEEIKKNE